MGLLLERLRARGRERRGELAMNIMAQRIYSWKILLKEIAAWRAGGSRATQK